MTVELFQAAPARPYRFELLPEDALASALELLGQGSSEVVGDPTQLDGALTRGLERAIHFAAAQAQEQREALILLSELAGLEADDAAEYLRRHQHRFHTGELGRLLFDKSREEAHHEPARALHLAEIALTAARLGENEDLPAAIRHDVRAEAWAAAADTRRLAGELAGADEAFLRAEEHLRSGSATLMVRADLLVRKAALFCDHGRFERGHKCVDQALAILRAGARPSEVSRALIAKGRLDLESGRPEAALDLFAEALDQLEGSTDRALWLAAHHNQAACLCELERFAEAREPLSAAASAVKLLGRPLASLRLCWLEGRCAEGTGRSHEAETAYLATAGGFLHRGLRVEAARASLDLARLYLRHRQLARMRRLVRPLLSVLRQIPAGWRRRPITDRSW